MWQDTSTTGTTGSEGAVYLSNIAINCTIVSPTTEAGWWRWLGNAVEVWGLNLPLTEIIVRHRRFPRAVQMAMLARIIDHLHEPETAGAFDDSARAISAYLLAEEAEDES